MVGGEPAGDVQAVTIVGSPEVLRDELRFEGSREFAMPATLDLDDRTYERWAVGIIGDRGDMDAGEEVVALCVSLLRCTVGDLAPSRVTRAYVRCGMPQTRGRGSQTARDGVVNDGR